MRDWTSWWAMACPKIFSSLIKDALASLALLALRKPRMIFLCFKLRDFQLVIWALRTSSCKGLSPMVIQYSQKELKFSSLVFSIRSFILSLLASFSSFLFPTQANASTYFLKISHIIHSLSQAVVLGSEHLPGNFRQLFLLLSKTALKFFFLLLHILILQLLTILPLQYFSLVYYTENSLHSFLDLGQPAIHLSQTARKSFLNYAIRKQQIFLFHTYEPQLMQIFIRFKPELLGPPGTPRCYSLFLL